MNGRTTILSSNRLSRPRRGFTLVELLVVIAILGILFSLLMPAIQGVQIAARSAQCQNNLHNLVMAWKNYDTDNIRTRAHGNTLAFDWTSALAPYLGNSMASMNCPEDNGARPGAGNAGGAGAGAGGAAGGGVGVGGGGAVAGNAGGAPGTQGNMKLMPEMPASLALHVVEDSSVVKLYQEQSSYRLPQAVAVDCTQPGSNWSNAGGSIPAGTMVDSYLIHYDPVGTANVITRNDSVRFAGKILGAIYTLKQLVATDPVLGRSGVTYAGNLPARNMEAGQDFFSLSNDLHALTVDQFHTSTVMEEVRIITEPGGDSSYGMNIQSPNPGNATATQVIFVDYQKSVIDLLNLDDPDDESWQANWHGGMSNAAMGDGSVKAVGPDFFDPNSPAWHK